MAANQPTAGTTEELMPPRYAQEVYDPRSAIQVRSGSAGCP
jgi:hypothetical protein